MKLISTSTELYSTFKSLMQSYDQYFWATAWADFDFDLSNLLIKHKNKISGLTVGLSFYGTHPKFLHYFKNHSCVNYILQSEGTYHPKVYLFENSEIEWALLIGSANFTKSAFSTNQEVCLLIDSTAVNSSETYLTIKELLSQLWNQGKQIDDSYIERYSKKKINFVPIPRGDNNGLIKPIYSRTWEQYLKELKKKDFDSRIRLLRWIENEFKKEPLFHKMTPEIRKSIAGFGYQEKVDVGCFGTTTARGYFKESVIKNPEIITKALEKIPLTGKVKRTHYDEFLVEFKKVSKQSELACATRLLCIKRPDVFVNFNGANRTKLCDELRINKNKVTYDSYWNLIIVPLMNSEWSKSPSRILKGDLEIYEKRVALLDCICYDNE